MMTPKQVTEEVAKIKEEAERGDYQNAHEMEDTLFREVLEAIANGAPRPRELAKVALRTRAIPFERYHA